LAYHARYVNIKIFQHILLIREQSVQNDSVYPTP